MSLLIMFTPESTVLNRSFPNWDPEPLCDGIQIVDNVKGNREPLCDGIQIVDNVKGNRF